MFRYCIALIAAMICLIYPLWAAPCKAQEGFLKGDCGDFQSGVEFLRAVSYLCLMDGRPRSCERGAEEEFNRCGYKGDFQKIWGRVHRELLIMLLVGKAPQLAARTDSERLASDIMSIAPQ